MLSPTVPIVAPPHRRASRPGEERDAAFFRVNALLLRNPTVVNMLDGCAISMPCHARGELPVGLMLWHAALHDDAVLAVALQAERALKTSARRAARRNHAKYRMKIAIVGAGIIGVTTAWELAADGHEVTVFERRGAAAEESSFANAGVVAPGYVTPWAAPGHARQGAALAARRRTAPIKLRWPLSARDVALDGALAARLQARDLPRQPRAHAAPGLLQPRTACTRSPRTCELEYERSDGYLVLLRSKREKKLVQPGLEVLRAAGSDVPRGRRRRSAQDRTRAQHRHRASPAPSTCPTTRSATAGSSRCCSSGRPRRWARSFISTATSRR